MATEAKMAEANKLMEQESFVAELEKATSDEEIIKLFGENGVEITSDDIKAMAEAAKKATEGEAEGELDEAALENVSGGWVFVVGVGAISFFYHYGKAKKYY